MGFGDEYVIDEYRTAGKDGCRRIQSINFEIERCRQGRWDCIAWLAGINRKTWRFSWCGAIGSAANFRRTRWSWTGHGNCCGEQLTISRDRDCSVRGVAGGGAGDT